MKRLKMKVTTLCMTLVIGLCTMCSPISAMAYYDEDVLDGRVTTFYQGDAPDCGAVSAIQAFDNSTYGKGFIMNLIKAKSNGSYVLNFATGKVTVSSEDVDNAPMSGDFDARVIEAGLQKAMNVYNGCFACDVFNKMTGFKQVQIRGIEARNNLMNTMEKECYAERGITAACDFNIADDEKGIIGDGGHSYSIRAVLKDTVVVINPWDTSEYIYMPRSQFENSIRYMTYIDDKGKKIIDYWC